MSIGRPVPLTRALEIAQQISELLAPVVARSKVAGSVRRQRPVIRDIEIVIEPRMQMDLLGSGTPEIETIHRKLRELGQWAKGGDRYVQILDVLGHEGLTLDTFLAHPPARFAVLLAIRTGPAELGQWAVTRMRKYGRRCEGGRILDMQTGAELPCESEAAFFEYAKLSCLPPRFRDSAGARAPQGHVA
jgi:DNA polymerase/3'-5' exonuclease PolX